MGAPLSTVPTHVAQETGFALSLGHLCLSFRPGGGYDDNDDADDENGNDDKGLFTYYVSQNQGFLDPPSPLRQQ